MAPGWMTEDKQPMPGMKENILDAPQPMGTTEHPPRGGRPGGFGWPGLPGSLLRVWCNRRVRMYTPFSLFPPFFLLRSVLLEENSSKLTTPRPQDRTLGGLHTAAEKGQPAEQEQRQGFCVSYTSNCSFAAGSPKSWKQHDVGLRMRPSLPRRACERRAAAAGWQVALAAAKFARLRTLDWTLVL